MLTLYHLFQSMSGSRNIDNNNNYHGNIHPPSIASLPLTHLQSLSLSCNLSSSIPLPSSTVAPWFLQTFLSSRYLVQKLTSLAEDIILDDVALLKDAQLDDECNGMTEEEVLDACWLRGLPVGRFVNAVHSDDAGDVIIDNLGNVDRSSPTNSDTNTKTDALKKEHVWKDIQIMRLLLTDHLQMMQTIMTLDPSSQFSSSETAGAALRSKGSLVRDVTLQLLILHLPAIRYQMMMHSKVVE